MRGRRSNVSDLIKWSGSKNFIAEEIITHFPEHISFYYEPFAGGGSVFLKLLESSHKVDEYYISDLNSELIGIYLLIKENPDLLISRYHIHYNLFNSKDVEHRKLYFNNVRADFNENKRPEDLYWIMRTVTKGLPRYNKKNEFNSSCHFNRPGMHPDKVAKTIMKYHALFANVWFIDMDYREIHPESNDFLYLDPPYQGTKGMYFGDFDNNEFICWANNLSSKWALSYNGKVDEDCVEHAAPEYKRHFYLKSGNSSFRRLAGDTNVSISESLYLNY